LSETPVPETVIFAVLVAVVGFASAVRVIVALLIPLELLNLSQD